MALAVADTLAGYCPVDPALVSSVATAFTFEATGPEHPVHPELALAIAYAFAVVRHSLYPKDPEFELAAACAFEFAITGSYPNYPLLAFTVVKELEKSNPCPYPKYP